jgi:hypothetical protein
LTGIIRSLAWTEAGALSVTYDDGTVVNVPVDPNYEAWNIVEVDGTMVVSLPGGGLATFPARAPGPENSVS